jgi:hypothetical protein
MLVITPKTKIGELLDAYPQLEPVLLSLSPAFQKLRTPILRRTIAKVATIQQISVVGNLPVDDIIKRLRREVGQPDADVQITGTQEIKDEPPLWLDKNRIKFNFNATPIINSGGSPMSEVLRQAGLLSSGDIMELHTPFVPAPIIDMIKGKKFLVYTVSKEDDVITYITRA